MSTVAHIYNTLLEIVTNTEHVTNTRTPRIVRSFIILTLRLIVQTFPIRHCSLTRSLSLRFHASSLDVSATGPKTTKNPPHCPWRDPDISPLTSQLTTTQHTTYEFFTSSHTTVRPPTDRPSTAPVVTTTTTRSYARSTPFHARWPDSRSPSLARFFVFHSRSTSEPRRGARE